MGAIVDERIYPRMGHTINADDSQPPMRCWQVTPRAKSGLCSAYRSRVCMARAKRDLAAAFDSLRCLPSPGRPSGTNREQAVDRLHRLGLEVIMMTGATRVTRWRRCPSAGG